jgi:hypothetical protein
VIRRLTGLILALSMFQLTSLDLRTECERHAPVRATGTNAAHAGHDMSSMNHGSAPAEDTSDSSVPAPKCCMVAGNCAGSAFSSIVLAAEVDSSDNAASIVARLDVPVSTSLAPEPPPPKS